MPSPGAPSPSPNPVLLGFYYKGERWRWFGAKTKYAFLVNSNIIGSKGSERQYCGHLEKIYTGAWVLNLTGAWKEPVCLEKGEGARVDPLTSVCPESFTVQMCTELSEGTSALLWVTVPSAAAVPRGQLLRTWKALRQNASG